MADKAEFLQAINEAILDADSLEKFINGSDSETVATRLNKRYPTLQKAIKELFENGGLSATPYRTKAQMQAATGAEGALALVYSDIKSENGFYVFENGAWKLSPYNYTKDVTDAFDALSKLVTKNESNILLSFEDKRDQTYAYFDSNANLNLKGRAYSDGKELVTSKDVSTVDAKANLAVVANIGSPIKTFTDIDNYSNDNLMKRMPFGIKLKDGRILCIYHKQVAGYDGDYAGSQFWKVFITINDDFSVSVGEPSLFIAADTPAGAIKHPTLGRTNDGRIILIYERREATRESYDRFIRFSGDEGQSFTSAIAVNPAGIAPSINAALGTTGNILTAKNNRLIVPMYTTGGTPFVIYSDDDGVSWTFSDYVRRPPGGNNWVEPSITMDADDNVLMDLRPHSGQGKRGKAISYDNGATWEYLGQTDIISPANQGTVFYDKSIGLMLRTHNNTTSTRTKYRIELSLDNDKTHPFYYQPFSDEWYGGYSQIIKLKEGVYAILVEYEKTFTRVNHKESSAVLILNLKEVFTNVNYN